MTSILVPSFLTSGSSTEAYTISRSVNASAVTYRYLQNMTATNKAKTQKKRHPCNMQNHERTSTRKGCWLVGPRTRYVLCCGGSGFKTLILNTNDRAGDEVQMDKTQNRPVINITRVLYLVLTYTDNVQQLRHTKTKYIRVQEGQQSPNAVVSLFLLPSTSYELTRLLF